MSDLSGRASIEIAAPVGTCFAMAADVERALLTERPLTGLKKESERVISGYPE